MKQTKDFLALLAEAIEEAIQIVLKKRMGFALLLFDFNTPGIGNYLSNANRQDMIKALRETADRIEQNQDIPKTEGSA